MNITEEINVWLRENAIQGQLHPFITFDCGYWKEARFHELNQRVWGWSVPWKKRTLIEIQLEMLDFQPPK